jgi:thiol-disulfide isomerase/thioredoxin
MAIKVIEFTTLEKTGKLVWDSLAPKMGVAYVVAITRDGCPACKKQKPRLDELAAGLAEKHGKRVVFTRIHVNYSSESQAESLRSKDLLRHYFYPTNLILIRSKDKGVIEYYRNVSPTMSELRRNIEKAVEVAKLFEKSK